MASIERRATLKGVTGTAHPRSLYDAKQRQCAVALHSQGAKMAAIARELGCHRQSVARWLAEAAAEMLE